MKQLTNGGETDRIFKQLQKFDYIIVTTESDVEHL